MELLRLFLFFLGLAGFAYLCVHPHPVPASPSLPHTEICPHTLSLNPPEFKPRTSLFALEDDIREIGAEGLACSPSTFGYSPEEAASLFPNKTYSSCEERTGYQGQIIKLAADSSSFTLNCDQGGVYAVGVTADLEELGTNRFTSPVLPYKGQAIPLSTEEYIFASCSNDPNVPFQDISYINRLNKTALSRAQNSSLSAPLHIIMLVLDSVSRRSFFRKLPQTIDLLNHLSDSFEAFDFKLHNVMGEHSNESFMPTFFGDMQYQRLQGKVYGDPFYERAVWKKMSEKVGNRQGFVSFLTTDDCGNDFAAFFGRNPKVDHLQGTFWCAAERFYNFKYCLRQKQRSGPALHWPSQRPLVHV